MAAARRGLLALLVLPACCRPWWPNPPWVVVGLGPCAAGTTWSAPPAWPSMVWPPSVRSRSSHSRGTMMYPVGKAPTGSTKTIPKIAKVRGGLPALPSMMVQ